MWFASPFGQLDVRRRDQVEDRRRGWRDKTCFRNETRHIHIYIAPLPVVSLDIILKSYVAVLLRVNIVLHSWETWPPICIEINTNENWGWPRNFADKVIEKMLLCFQPFLSTWILNIQVSWWTHTAFEMHRKHHLNEWELQISNSYICLWSEVGLHCFNYQTCMWKKWVI